MKNALYYIKSRQGLFCMLRKALFIVSLLPLLLLSSCMDELDLFKSPFAVVYPHNNAKYIGDTISDFKITYSKPVTTADVFLNGVRISNEFNYGSESAVARIADIRKHLKEGDNVLTVDPLAFGPTIRFVADTTGPEILVKDGREDPNNPGKFRIRGDLRDASAISELKVTLVTVDGIDEQTGELSRQSSEPIPIAVKQDKSWEIDNLNVANTNIYRFEATDIHGFKTVKEYLANNAQTQSLAVGNAVRLAVGDTLVKSLKPFIASAIYQGLEEKPIDVYNVCPSNKPDCSTFPPGLNPVRLNMDLLGGGTAILKNLYMSKPKSTVLLNDFTVLEGNKIFINLDITDMAVDLDIRGTALGFLPIDAAMALKIGRTAVVSDAELSVVNKKMHLKLVNSNIGLDDIETSKVVVWGIDLTFIAGPIVGLLEGLIADMLPDILNPIFEENLQKLVIGGRMYDEEEYDEFIENGGNESQLDGNVKAYFDWALNIETIVTDSVLGGAQEMIVSLETLANVLPTGVDHDIENRALGSIYVEDPIKPDDIFNAKAEGTANLTFALSSNALNQAFVAIYNTGLSHFTLYDGKMHYGADKTKPEGMKGETRIRLYPESPPFFILQSIGGQVGNAAEASIGYESAVLYMDKHDGTEWKSQVELHVDLKIAASIDQEDNIVKLGISGSPVLNINKTINNTSLPITNKLLQTIVDAVFVYFVPTINENFFNLDMAEIAEGMNGTRVFYRHHDTSTDMTGTLVKRHNRYEFNVACDGVNECVPKGEQGCDKSGGCIHVCDTLGVGSYGIKEGGSLVCQTINFEMSTNTVGSTGNRGSNLFFQMQANEIGFQPPPGLPRFDLDGDGVMDFRDNCAVPQQMIEAAVSLEGGILANVNPDGTPKAGFEKAIKDHVNAWVACDLAGTNALNSGSCGAYREQPYASPSFNVKLPTHSSIINDPSYRALGNRNIVQWWDYMRKGDDPIADMLHEFEHPWIALRYNNPNQRDTDGDRIGELCEDDSDRDGIYTSNGFPIDNCPSILDPSNNPGACTIDAVAGDGTAAFVLFKNMKLSSEKGEPWCLSHNRFNGVPDNTGGTANFAPGGSTQGRQLTWAKCDSSDLKQRFYITVTEFERTGVSDQEKVVYIYTNAGKQSAPGWYDGNFYHFLATTVSSATPNIGDHYRPTPNDKHWAQDSVIVTAMPGYANESNTNWRQWVLSLSMKFNSTGEPVAGQEAFENYPYIIESMRIWDVYGRDGGVDPGRRDCIYYTGTNGGNGVADTNKGSCYPDNNVERQRAAFDILLGDDMQSWRGRYSTD